MSAPPPPPVPVPARRRRRWLRVGVTVLAMVIIVPIMLVGYSRYSNQRAREAAEAETDCTDPDWRMPQLLLARRQVADEENSALHIIATANKAKNFDVHSAPEYFAIFAKQPANTRLNDRQVDLLRRELNKIPGPLVEARALKDYPYGRFPIKIEPIFFTTRLPDQQKTRQLCDWLKHDAFLLAHDEKYDDAVESCQACLCVARSMGDEPIIISHLTRLAIQIECVIALECVLAQGEPGSAKLLAMQKLLDLEVNENNWLQAIRGERAGSQLLFDELGSGKLPISTIGFNGPAMGSRFADWMADNFPSTLLRYYPEYLRHMSRCVEIARLPLHEQKSKMLAWDEQTKASNNPILKLLTPSVVKVHQVECRRQAEMRAAAAALACERYRRELGAWPESLDAVVQAKFLDAVPLDPIDGKPMRFRKDRDTIVIYSIGHDEQDDGGHIDRDQRPPGVDVGFRLWAPSRRRQ